MKLLERYATACGLEIGQQFLLEAFFPIAYPRYVTLQGSSGMVAKNYPYYSEVLSLILPILEKEGIKILQIGGPDDAAIPGCFDLRGKTSPHHTNYLLNRTLLHWGSDSWCAHRAGELGVPLLTLFGPTSVANHSAYKYDKDRTIFLESHRWGRKPNFASQENPLTIALIPPELVANSVLKLLSLPPLTPARKSLLIGPLYQHTIIELVPDSFPTKDFLPQLPITVRMDYHFDEKNLGGLLSTARKVNVVTNRPVDLNLINQFRQSILFYSHELKGDGSDLPPLDYIRTIKTLVPKTTFFTKERDETALANLRFRLFDVATIEQVTDLTKADAINWVKDYLNLPELTDAIRLDISSQLCQSRIRSNKFLLAGGKVYLSFAHFKAQKPIAGLDQNVSEMIDDPDCWRDLNHLYAYNES